MVIVFLTVSTVLLFLAAGISSWVNRATSRGTAKELGVDAPLGLFDMLNKNKCIQYDVWQRIKLRDDTMKSLFGYKGCDLIPYNDSNWLFCVPIDKVLSDSYYANTPFVKDKGNMRYYLYKYRSVFHSDRNQIIYDYNIYTNKWDLRCVKASYETNIEIKNRLKKYKLRNEYGYDKYRCYSDVKIIELTQQELADKISLDRKYNNKISMLINLNFEDFKKDNSLITFEQWEDARLKEIYNLVSEANSYDVCWRWRWDERIYSTRPLKSRPYKTERENTRDYLESMLENSNNKYSFYKCAFIPETKQNNDNVTLFETSLEKSYKYREWYEEDGVGRIMKI